MIRPLLENRSRMVCLKSDCRPHQARARVVASGDGVWIPKSNRYVGVVFEQSIPTTMYRHLFTRRVHQ